MLLKPLIYYDKVYLYSKNIDQEKYQLLANELNKIAKKNKFSVDKIYEYCNSSIKDVNELENKLQNLIRSLSTLSKEDIRIVYIVYISANHIIKLTRI